MKYDGEKRRFLEWFEWSVQLFRELTKNYSDEERLQITVDLGNTHLNQISNLFSF